MRKSIVALFIVQLLLTVPTLSQETWEQIAPYPVSFDLFGISHIDSSIFAVGASKDFLKSTDGGRSWKIKKNVFPVQMMYDVYFATKLLGWAVGSPGIHKTTDGGETWISSTFSFQARKMFFLSIDTIWCVGNGGKIVKTTNGGTAWIEQTSGTTGDIKSVFFINKNLGWACGGANILKTTNGGSTWTIQTLGTDNFQTISFGSATTGWAAGASGVVRKTTDGGTTWVSQNLAANSSFVGLCCFDTASVILVDYIYGISKTTNGGTSWVPMGLPNYGIQVYAISFRDSTKGYAGGLLGYILEKGAGSNNWTRLSKGNNLNLSPIMFISENTGFGASGLALLKTTDGGHFWDSIATFAGINALTHFDSVTYFGSGYSGIFIKSTDGGITWTRTYIPGSPVILSIYFSSKTTGILVGNAGKIYKTTDAGTTFTESVSHTTENLNALFYCNSSAVYACGTNGVFLKSTDAGNTWALSQVGTYNNRALFFYSDLVGWVANSSQNIFRTTDGGNTWQTTAFVYGENFSWIYFKSRYAGFAKAYSQIYKTTDGGVVWSMHYNLDFVSSSTDFISPFNGWFAGLGGGRVIKYSAGNATLTLKPEPGDVYTSGTTKNIIWKTNQINTIKIDYSTNGGSTWLPVAGSYSAASGSFPWVVPFTPSSNCVIRVADALDPSIYSLSDGKFNIVLPQSDSIYVIIGKVDAAKKDTVSMDINVQLPEGSSFSSFQLDIGGFKNLLQYYQVDTVGTLAGKLKWMFYANLKDSILYTAGAGTANVTGSGVLFRLKFIVPATSTAGFKPVTARYCIFNTGTVITQLISGGVSVLVPFYGDADLNVVVQAYDASVVLKYIAGSIPFNLQQRLNADATADNSISALDASTIMQYVVHIIDSLPHTPVVLAQGNVSMPTASIRPGQIIEIPLSITNANNIFAYEGTIRFSPDILKFEGLTYSNMMNGYTKESRFDNDKLKFAGAAIQAGITNGVFAIARFSLQPGVTAASTTIMLERLRLNENQALLNSTLSVISIITSAKDGIVPINYGLDQNFPNPFNPSTIINYRLAQPGKTRLAIYTVLGQLVKELVNEYKDAGEYQVTVYLDGLSSGIYLYELKSGAFTSTKKMILAK